MKKIFKPSKIFFSSSLGFTLTELLISAAILGIIVVISTVFFINSLKTVSLQMTRTEIHRDAREIINLIKRDLAQGRNLSITISSTPPLLFNRIDFVRGSTDISYFQTGNSVVKQINTTNTITVCKEGVIRLSFMFPNSSDPSKVGVSVQMEKKSNILGDIKVKYTSQTEIVEVPNP